MMVIAKTIGHELWHMECKISIFSWQGKKSKWRNTVYQRKPCSQQFTAKGGWENPGKDGKME